MQQTIKLGNLTLPRTAGLAPMAGVADRAYRILCKENQAALLVSEMISAKGLCNILIYLKILLLKLQIDLM